DRVTPRRSGGDVGEGQGAGGGVGDRRAVKLPLVGQGARAGGGDGKIHGAAGGDGLALWLRDNIGGVAEVFAFAHRGAVAVVHVEVALGIDGNFFRGSEAGRAAGAVGTVGPALGAPDDDFVSRGVAAGDGVGGEVSQVKIAG